MDKVCPTCGERYKWYETECPNCHVALVDLPPRERPQPDLRLTVVFRTNEPGLLPLATLALEQGQIEFVTRIEGTDAMAAGGEAYRGHLQDVPVEILVRSEQAAAAIELLKDLQQAPGSSGPSASRAASPPAPGSGGARGEVKLVDLATSQVVGNISDDDLRWLGGQLEKESVDDRDYYFDRATIDMLETAGANAGLLAVLRGALGDRTDMELRWTHAS